MDAIQPNLVLLARELLATGPKTILKPGMARSRAGSRVRAVFVPPVTPQPNLSRQVQQTSCAIVAPHGGAVIIVLEARWVMEPLAPVSGGVAAPPKGRWPGGKRGSLRCRRSGGWRDDDTVKGWEACCYG